MLDEKAEFLSTNDAAIVLQVSSPTVLEYERRGLLVSVRTAGGWRLFLREDVERLRPLVPLKRGRPRKEKVR